MKFYRVTDKKKLENIPEQYNGKEVVLKLIEELESAIKVQKSKLEYMRFLVSHGIDSNNLHNSIMEFYSKLNYMMKKTRKIGELSGTVEVEEYRSVDALDAEFIEEEDKLRIVFSELLPRRITETKATNLMTHQQIRKMYQATFSEYTKHRTIYPIQNKIIIRYIHFYEPKQNVIDYDNFETKPITDLIVPLFTYDDSPMQVVMMNDYRIGNDFKNHTEIEVMPCDDKHLKEIVEQVK